LDLIGLDWIGMEWNGLDWIGLDWIGLDWIGLDWIGLDRIESNRSGPRYISPPGVRNCPNSKTTERRGAASGIGKNI